PLFFSGANWQLFFFRLSIFARMSAPGSPHFLITETSGLAVSARICVRRYCHSPVRKWGSSTEAPDPDADVAPGVGADALEISGAGAACCGSAARATTPVKSTADATRNCRAPTELWTGIGDSLLISHEPAVSTNWRCT